MVVFFFLFFLPCFLVAELFRDDFPQLKSEPVGDPLRQILVRAPAENLNIRHLLVFRGLALRTIKQRQDRKPFALQQRLPVEQDGGWCVGEIVAS